MDRARELSGKAKSKIFAPNLSLRTTSANIILFIHNGVTGFSIKNYFSFPLTLQI
jgi:hypothetical protein